MTSPDDSTMHSGAAESGWAVVLTDLGPAWVEWSGDHPIRLGLPGSDPPPGTATTPPAVIGSLVDALEDYWSGNGSLPPPPQRAVAGSTFADEVRRVVCAIPPGETLTYGEVATRAGRPAAARAVGAAMAANRLAPLVPCHRVIGSDGSLRGYAGGLDMKRNLLEMERSHAR